MGVDSDMIYTWLNIILYVDAQCKLGFDHEIVEKSRKCRILNRQGDTGLLPLNQIK